VGPDKIAEGKSKREGPEGERRPYLERVTMGGGPGGEFQGYLASVPVSTKKKGGDPSVFERYEAHQVVWGGSNHSINEDTIKQKVKKDQRAMVEKTRVDSNCEKKNPSLQTLMIRKEARGGDEKKKKNSGAKPGQEGGGEGKIPFALTRQLSQAHRKTG